MSYLSKLSVRTVRYLVNCIITPSSAVHQNLHNVTDGYASSIACVGFVKTEKNLKTVKK
jgi:hypothetical protein